MKLSLRLGTAWLALALPLLAHAEIPESVTGITALANEAGAVEVYWNPVTGDNIAAYHVYYSGEPILENGGRYDDYEIADGTANAHALFNLPPYSRVFVSVLAINTDGEESPYFVEEAEVVLNSSTGNSDIVIPNFGEITGEIEGEIEPVSSTPTATAQPSSMASSSTAAVSTLVPLEASALSATGVSIRFNTTVRIDQTRAVGAVRIETASGQVLSLRRYVLEGNTLTVHTDTQVKGQVYKVVISAAVEGVNPDGSTVSIDASQAPLLFAGHETGKEPEVTQASSTPTQSSSTPATQAEEVRNLRMNAEEVEDNAYNVDVTWEAPSTGTVREYRVAQSTDGGKTFSDDAATNGTAARINGVTVRNYSVRVRTVYIDGTVTSGAVQNITLPRASGNVAGSVIGQGKGGSLPSSGPALGVIAIGAATGAWKLRKKKKAA